MMKIIQINEGNAFSYILPKTLEISGSSLIAKRDGLDNLEVCMLEINPYDIKHRDQMKEILENWLRAMGVKEKNITIAETDLPVNVQTVIKSFLDE